MSNHGRDDIYDQELSDKLKSFTYITNTQQEIIDECERIKVMLLDKNRKYGDSAIKPIRCFSKASPLEQINVRLDDKLNRIINRQDDEDEDVEDDLIGYLVLKKVAKKIAAAAQEEPSNVK